MVLVTRDGEVGGCLPSSSGCRGDDTQQQHEMRRRGAAQRQTRHRWGSLETVKHTNSEVRYGEGNVTLKILVSDQKQKSCASSPIK